MKQKTKDDSQFLCEYKGCEKKSVYILRKKDKYFVECYLLSACEEHIESVLKEYLNETKN